MTFTISPLTIDRYEDVITLWKETEGIGLSDADSKKNIQFYLERNPNMSFVVKDKEGTILGTVLCGYDGRRGYNDLNGINFWKSIGWTYRKDLQIISKNI